jgi:hypothetical protein
MTVKTERGNNVVRTGKFSCEFTEYYRRMEGLFGKTLCIMRVWNTFYRISSPATDLEGS